VSGLGGYYSTGRSAWFPAATHGPRPARRTHNDIDQRVDSFSKVPTQGKIGGISGHVGSHREVGIRWSSGDQRMVKRANAVKDPIGGVQTNIFSPALPRKRLGLAVVRFAKEGPFPMAKGSFRAQCFWARCHRWRARFVRVSLSPYVIRRLPFLP
jgi:hypothetical protein